MLRGSDGKPASLSPPPWLPTRFEDGSVRTVVTSVVGNPDGEGGRVEARAHPLVVIDRGHETDAWLLVVGQDVAVNRGQRGTGQQQVDELLPNG